jgi:hypothetical protein
LGSQCANEKQRTESIVQIYREWHGRDAAAADAALKSAGFQPENVKEFGEAH